MRVRHLTSGDLSPSAIQIVQDLIPLNLYMRRAINVTEFQMKRIFFILLTLSLFTTFILKIDFQRFNQNTGCPFCNSDILERQVFYRGEGGLGILTHKPAVPGHILIIPERHVERFEDLTANEMRGLGETIKQVDRIIRKRFGNTDYLLIQKNGRGVGQTVPHVHFHYLPSSKFLAAKFLISPMLKPLSKEEIKRLNESLSESF